MPFYDAFTINQLNEIRTKLNEDGININKDKPFGCSYLSKVFSEELSAEAQLRLTA